MENTLEKLVVELHDSFSNNDFEKTLSMATDHINVEAYALGSSFNGKDEFKQFIQGFKGAFPDMRITHKNIVSNDQEVAVEFVATGKHTGNLVTPAGIVPPTGRSVSLNVCEVQTWENGKLKSIRNYQDATSLMHQLGLLG